MAKTIQICLLLSTLLFIALSVDTLTIVCDKTDQCDSGQGYIYTMNDDTGVQCLENGEQCPPGSFNMSLETVSCSSDYNGTTCSSEICFRLSDLAMCMPSEQCQSFEITTKCGACQTISEQNCPKQICAEAFGLEGCFDDEGGCLASQYVTKIGSCSNNMDSSGNACNCYSQLDVCSSFFQFDSPKLRSFLNRNMNSESGLGVSYLIMALCALLVWIQQV